MKKWQIYSASRAIWGGIRRGRMKFDHWESTAMAASHLKPFCFAALAGRSVALALGLAFLGNTLPAAAAGPNIVVVVTDDLSVDAFNALSEGGWLPNIEEHIVDAGVRFDNAFVTNALCCPSRATFLTGQYSHNHGVLSNVSTDPFKAGYAWPGWLPTSVQSGRNESTIATWLEAAGYYTGFIGKHLNGYGIHAPEGTTDPRTYVPPGWTEWYGLIDPTTYRVYDYDINENGTVVHHGAEEADYQTDVLAAHAVGFLQRGLATSKPVFLLVNTLAPHIENTDSPETLLEGNDPLGGFALSIRPAPRHAHLIDGDPDNGELPLPQHKPSFNESDLSDKHSCPAPLPPLGIVYVTDSYCVAERPSLALDPDVARLEAQYKGMLASMLAVDDLIGQIVAVLTSARQPLEHGPHVHLGQRLVLRRAPFDWEGSRL